jgi:hypothetical protein
MRSRLALGCLLAAACGGEAFECGGKVLGVFVPASAVCDGRIDCWGGQDERQDGCTTALSFCDQPEPQAVLASVVCDGTADCDDGFDEASCE